MSKYYSFGIREAHTGDHQIPEIVEYVVDNLDRMTKDF